MVDTTVSKVGYLAFEFLGSVKNSVHWTSYNMEYRQSILLPERN